jgi:GGDEF domain-containing protein
MGTPDRPNSELDACTVRRVAEALSEVGEPDKVALTSCDVLRAQGVRHVLLRQPDRDGCQWTTTLPDWVVPHLYGEHLALLAYGSRLGAMQARDIVWAEDIDTDARFISTRPFATRLGFRSAAFCPITQTDPYGGETWWLVVLCWAERQPRTPTALDVMQALTALIVVSLRAANLSQAAHALERSPSLDPDTGLPSRALMARLGPRELAAAKRRGEPVACLVVKPAVPAVGEAGAALDETATALGTAGRTIRALTRATDLVGHHREHSYCVLIPGADRGRALRVAERLGEALSGLSAEGPPLPGGRPVVAGVAGYAADGQRYGSLVAMAEAGLEQAGRQGYAVLVADERSGGLTAYTDAHRREQDDSELH